MSVQHRVIRTVGHGATTAPLFTALVRAAGIGMIVDVRRFPASRRHPHFGKEEMARWLADAGVQYRWLAGLGGRRKVSADSTNVALRNPQFRAYADYMSTPEFGDAVGELLDIAGAAPAAVMCSEAVWWRCHRRLLADHLVLVEGMRVEHLFHDGRVADHLVTPGARRAGRNVAYDAPSPETAEDPS